MNPIEIEWHQLKLLTKQIISTLASKGANNNLKNKLIKGAAGSFGLKIAASGLTFIMSVIFARFLGTAGLGTYSYAITWANLLSIPAALGIDQLIVREMAIYRHQSRWSLMAGILRWSNFMVCSAGIILALVAIAIARNLPGSDTSVIWAVAIAVMSVPIIALTSLRMGAMRGLHRVIVGEMPDTLFAPIIIITLVCGSYVIFPTRFNVFWVLGIKITASLIAFVIGTIWLWRSLPSQVNQVTPEYQSKKWLIDALPFMFLGTSQLLNSRIDLLMLGTIKGVEAVGIYAVLLGIVRLSVFIHQAANSVLGPAIATLYSEGKIKQLEKMLRKSMVMVSLVSLAIGGIVILLENQILLIFGSEFLAGRTAMNILIIGPIFTSLTGSLGLVLNMTGYQNYTAIAVGCSAVLNMILNSITIPIWGINGAAIATTTSLVTINMVQVFLVQQKLGIYLYSLKKID